MRNEIFHDKVNTFGNILKKKKKIVRASYRARTFINVITVFVLGEKNKNHAVTGVHAKCNFCQTYDVI